MNLGNWTNGSVCYLQPDLDGEWIHEAEEPGGFPTGDLEEDGDAQVHEGLHGKGSRHFVFDFLCCFRFELFFCTPFLQVSSYS